MKKNFVEETTNIDNCECVYCGHKFDGQSAINNNLDTGTVICPNCKNEMRVLLSVTYTCQNIS